MKAQYRIKKSDEFLATMKRGKLYKNCAYVIYLKPNTFSNVRIGISTSKKLGNAVIRNRIRRQVRAMIHNLINYECQKDIVIIVKKDYLDSDFQTNKTLLENLLSKEEGILK
ncbi:MAG: ribonuclease P protein component [Bacilli bacterium]